MPIACLLALALAPAFVSRELNFRTTDGLTLHGTYLEPVHPAKAKVHAVLLLAGSGPTDRDGNQPPGLQTDILKQFAEGLAAKGIASYRFDKRATATNAAQWPKDTARLDDFFSFEHFRDDAISALNELKKQPGVDPGHVGVLGHSEGGLITLVIASRLGDRQIPGICLVGTAGRNYDVLIQEQILAILHRQTSDPKVIDDFMTKLKSADQHVMITGTRPTGLPTGLQPLFSPGTGKILQSEMLLDPLKLAASYNGKVLMLQGEMDANVSFQRDFPPLKRAFEGRKQGALTGLTFPSASHCLKHVDKPTDPGEDGQIPSKALEAAFTWAERL